VAGITVEGKCDNIVIQNNIIHDIQNSKGGAHGIGVYGNTSPIGITNLTINNNQLYNLVLGQSESLVLNGNVQYWTISNNIIHESDNIGIDIIGYEGTASNTYDYARNGIITGNLIYNIDDNNNPTYPKNDNSADGIYVDGGSDVIIDSNILHHNNIGIEIASEHKNRNSQNVIVRNNLIYSCTGPGLSIGGYNKQVGSTSNCQIINNTLFQNDTLKTGSGELQIQYFPPSGILDNGIYNNIFYANNQGLLISNPFNSSMVTLDYNLYYSPVNSSMFEWNNKSYNSFNKYQSVSNMDLNSINKNPLFTNINTPTLTLTSNSPAINTGKVLDLSIVGSTDLSGKPRISSNKINIGAYQ